MVTGPVLWLQACSHTSWKPVRGRLGLMGPWPIHGNTWKILWRHVENTMVNYHKFMEGYRNYGWDTMWFNHVGPIHHAPSWPMVPILKKQTASTSKALRISMTCHVFWAYLSYFGQGTHRGGSRQRLLLCVLARCLHWVHPLQLLLMGHTLSARN